MPDLTANFAEVSSIYRSEIGRPRGDLMTPALILDLDQAKRNIAKMAEFMKGAHAGLRPHIKVHKSPELSRMQMDAGAIGVCTATVWEALLMVRGGIGDVLVANEVVGEEKIRALAELAGEARMSVAADDAQNVAEISKAAQRAGSEVGVLVDLDVGMQRCGVRTKEQALELAALVARLPGLRFEGLMGYEGHCMLEPDPDLRVQKAHSAIDKVADVADFLAAAGLECKAISGGGTGTYAITGVHPRLTELQAGSYVVMDAFHADLVTGFPVALTVLGTVISRQDSRIVLDTGRKNVGSELGLPRLKDVPSVTAAIAEEHLLVDVDAFSEVRVGSKLEVVPGYGPTTVNLHEVYFVVEKGTVTDFWPIRARGSGLGVLG